MNLRAIRWQSNRNFSLDIQQLFSTCGSDRNCQLLYCTVLRGQKQEKLCSDFGFGGICFITIDANILRNLDETDRCQVLSSREDENKDKVKQNGAQNENLTLLHSSSQASELLLVGFGWMEESDSHLSAIYSQHAVTFVVVQCND